MSRINYRQLVVYFLVYVVIQLPLLNKFVFMDAAFGLFYIGFLLFVPFGINPFLRLTSGFFVGLIIDIFANTPGLHAAAGTLTMFVRDYWLLMTIDEPEDDPNLSVFQLGARGTFLYLFPLILFHLFIVFTIEHGKLENYLAVMKRTIFSSVFTFICITVFNLVVIRKQTRF